MGTKSLKAFPVRFELTTFWFSDYYIVTAKYANHYITGTYTVLKGLKTHLLGVSRTHNLLIPLNYYSQTFCH